MSPPSVLLNAHAIERVQEWLQPRTIVLRSPGKLPLPQDLIEHVHDPLVVLDILSSL